MKCKFWSPAWNQTYYMPVCHQQQQQQQQKYLKLSFNSKTHFYNNVTMLLHMSHCQEYVNSGLLLCFSASKDLCKCFFLMKTIILINERVTWHNLSTHRLQSYEVWGMMSVFLQCVTEKMMEGSLQTTSPSDKWLPSQDAYLKSTCPLIQHQTVRTIQ